MDVEISGHDARAGKGWGSSLKGFAPSGPAKRQFSGFYQDFEVAAGPRNEAKRKKFFMSDQISGLPRPAK
ncbi:MAG: hypothetical protein IKQ25_09355 [Lachnospiraceae bacterium]|nr:hypothetical protein [Lachnospiraceae bacterium]